jgi:hypothetical protein
MNRNILLFFVLILLVSCENEPIVDITDNALSGLFSVSPMEQVRFSPGNLQYQASTNTWRFAENQFDVVGSDNSLISSNYDGWIDLFGWGTSGYDGCEPYLTSSDVSLYARGMDSIVGTNWDWGVFNTIVNGGNRVNLWRLLTREEWMYLFYYRQNALDKIAVGCIDGVNGLILLSDDFVLPDSLEFVCDFADDSGEDFFCQINNYTIAEWRKMEMAGAIFFPAAGGRLNKQSWYTGVTGYYWSATAFEYDSISVYCMGFDSSRAVAEGLSNRSNGRSVRLVRRKE